MTLSYSHATDSTAKVRSRASTWTGVILTLSFAVSATLCARAIRWDRWAHYEDTHRPFWDGFGGESGSSFKAWHAWRASWERASVAALFSGAAFFVAAIVAAAARLRAMAISRWLFAAMLLHALVIAYFLCRWGPNFRHPHATWTG